MTADFPSKVYLKKLVKHLEEKVKSGCSQRELLLMYSGALLNWLGDFFTDPSVKWRKQKIFIGDLFLTGTNPQWNKIIIQHCKRDPQRLKELLQSNRRIQRLFKNVKFENIPILVREERGKLKVLDGMRRVVGAIKIQKETIDAYVALPVSSPYPSIEPHVVYDLLRAYQRGLNTNKTQLIVALKFLIKSYKNVRELLRKRFNKKWLDDEDVRSIIQKALK